VRVGSVKVEDLLVIPCTERHRAVLYLYLSNRCGMHRDAHRYTIRVLYAIEQLNQA